MVYLVWAQVQLEESENENAAWKNWSIWSVIQWLNLIQVLPAMKVQIYQGAKAPCSCLASFCGIDVIDAHALLYNCTQALNIFFLLKLACEDLVLNWINFQRLNFPLDNSKWQTWYWTWEAGSSWTILAGSTVLELQQQQEWCNGTDYQCWVVSMALANWVK